MDRRRLLLTALAWAITAPHKGHAQPTGKVARVGILAGNPPDTNLCLHAVKAGLSELGYVEGRTHNFELRWTDGETEPFPKLARELSQLDVDVIVVLTALAIPSTKAATPTIPIVMASSSYPVELGLIGSLSRPGGNVTGIANFTPGLLQKRVQILKEVVPSAQRVAVLRLAGRIQDLYVKDFTIAAHQLGVDLQVIPVQHVNDLAAAFETANRGKAQAVMSTQGPFFGVHNTATRAMPGRTSLRSSSHFAVSSVTMLVTPVMLPPGLAPCKEPRDRQFRIAHVRRTASRPVRLRCRVGAA